jgi:uncharacterized protein (TIGR02145 family)/prepilin-type N-terminal cleavage/methylation domain-containing protein
MLRKKAFTLIELLVVIAIIGLLATISVIALNNARAKARDVKRVADVKQVQTALELFFNDMGRYPTAAEFNSGSLFSTSTNSTTTYMATIPAAPNPADGGCSSTTNQYIYSSASDGSTYNLSFCAGGQTGALAGGGSCSKPSGSSDGLCPCGTDTICGLHCFYSGQLIHTVQIGNQCWFQGNLNIGTQISAGNQGDAQAGNFQKYCSGGDSLNCDVYGGLYQWHTIMGFPTSCDSPLPFDSNGDGTYTGSCGGVSYTIQAKHRGICPTGWHVPSDTDQDVLDQLLNDTTCNSIRANSSGCANAGTKLITGGTSGFEALFSGNSMAPANTRGTYAYFWSATAVGNYDANYRRLQSGYATVYRYQNGRSGGFSVRCLKD